jgi:hypothetical protein
MAKISYEVYIVHYDEFYCISELTGKNNKNIDDIVKHIKEFGHLPVDTGCSEPEYVYHVEVIKHFYDDPYDPNRVEFSVYPDRETEGLPKYVNKIVDEIYARLTV